ncbi:MULTISPECIES: hypothetical protein [Chitinophagaceae]
MKVLTTKRTAFLASVILVFLCTNASAQFGKLKDLVNNSVGNVLNSSQLKLLRTDPITTNFDDCNKTKTLPVDFGKDSIAVELCAIVTTKYDKAKGFALAPGFYHGSFKSFCLKAGTYAPSKGDGYLFAPLAGKKSDLVYTLIANWENHPEIEQHDVQVLLWAIIAKTNITKMSPDMQATAAKLLSSKDLNTLKSSALDFLSGEALSKLTDNLPEPAKTIAIKENELRDKLYQGNASYDQIANIAMLAGAAPENPQFPRGIWTYHPEGYYIKYLPHSYTMTEVEIYVPVTAGTIYFLPVGDVAVPANTGAQRLGQSNILVCEKS